MSLRILGVSSLCEGWVLLVLSFFPFSVCVCVCVFLILRFFWRGEGGLGILASCGVNNEA